MCFHDSLSGCSLFRGLLAHGEVGDELGEFRSEPLLQQESAFQTIYGAKSLIT